MNCEGDLQYFTFHEFDRDGENWFHAMHPWVLRGLDLFRHEWGKPVRISPHPLALGRRDGTDTLSDHNIDKWGRVLAADVMPEGMEEHGDAYFAVVLADRVGFTSIGLYPDWKPGGGLHLGVRPGRKLGDPAQWGAVDLDGKQTYVSLDAALDGWG